MIILSIWGPNTYFPPSFLNDVVKIRFPFTIKCRIKRSKDICQTKLHSMWPQKPFKKPRMFEIYIIALTAFTYSTNHKSFLKCPGVSQYWWRGRGHRPGDKRRGTGWDSADRRSTVRSKTKTWSGKRTGLSLPASSLSKQNSLIGSLIWMILFMIPGRRGLALSIIMLRIVQFKTWLLTEKFSTHFALSGRQEFKVEIESGGWEPPNGCSSSGPSWCCWSSHPGWG